MISILGLMIQSSLFIGSGIISGLWNHKHFFRRKDNAGGGGNNGFTINSLRLLSDFTVAFSVVIAELVLCEIGDWVDPEARFFVWKLATNVLLILVGVIIPFAEVMLIVGLNGNLSVGPGPNSSANSASNKFKFLLGLILYSIYIGLFIYVGRYIPMEGDKHSTTTTTTFTESIITRIGFVGVTAMAILCGVSTVSAPYTVFISRQSPVNQTDIDRLQSAIITTNSLIENKKNILQTLRLKLSHRINNSSSSNLMFKVLTTLRVGSGDDLSNEIKALEMEIASFQSMKCDLERDIESLKAKFSNQTYSQTINGKIKIRLYYIFSIYCIYRLINILVIRNPFMMKWVPEVIYSFGTKNSSGITNSDINPPTKPESDALVISLAHMIMKVSPQSEIDALSRQIGFAVSGLLFLASISSVITTFNTLAKAFPFLHSKKSHQHLHSTTNLTSPLLISHVLAIYVISTSLLLRSNLPSKMSSAITSALGSPLNVSSVQAWSDSVIFVSTCIMVVGLYLANKYRSSDETTLYDEESLIESKFD